MIVSPQDYGRGYSIRDTQGVLRTPQSFKGQVVALYFGYLYCPDVCPTALARAVEVKKLLGPMAEHLKVIYVTVDPERDTAELINNYLAAFDPSFIGLRGDSASIESAAKNLNVHYKKVPTKSGYAIEHTAKTYVYDPKGHLRLLHKHEQAAVEMAHDVRMLIAGH